MRFSPRLTAAITATATAATLAVAPHANAATVGPREGDTCEVTFSREERMAYHAAVLKYQRMGYSQAMARGLESAYPGLKKIGDEFIAKPNIREIDKQLGRTSGVDRQNYLNNHYYPYTDRVDEIIGKDFEYGGQYLALRIAEKYPDLNAHNMPDVSEAEVAAAVDNDTNNGGVITDEVTDTPFEVNGLTITPATTYDEFLDATAPFGPADGREKAFLEGFKKSQEAKQWYEELLYPLAIADAQARDACAAGGGKVVEYPTLKQGTKQGSSLKDENGTLTPGGIVLVIFGIIAALGAAVAAFIGFNNLTLP